jgi:hypothetical protein
MFSTHMMEKRLMGIGSSEQLVWIIVGVLLLYPHNLLEEFLAIRMRFADVSNEIGVKKKRQQIDCVIIKMLRNLFIFSNVPPTRLN